MYKENTNRKKTESRTETGEKKKKQNQAPSRLVHWEQTAAIDNISKKQEEQQEGHTREIFKNHFSLTKLDF